MDVLKEAFATHNLPLTMLLGAVLLYWLLVLAGLLDFDIDLLEGDAPNLGHAPDSAIGGSWLTATKTLGFSSVPTVIWASFFILFLWGAALTLNYHFNPPRSLSKAALLLVPGAVGSLVLTKIITIPIGKLFKAMADADNENVEVIGQEGTIVSTHVTERSGQLQLENTGAPVLLNVRLQPGTHPLAKGARAKVTAAGPDHAFYFIEPVIQQPNQ